MSRQTREKAQAQKKAAKKAAYDRPQEQRELSRYAKRVRARRNGRPMADRSGERLPWWDAGPGLPLSGLMRLWSSHVEKQAA